MKSDSFCRKVGANKTLKVTGKGGSDKISVAAGNDDNVTVKSGGVAQVIGIEIYNQAKGTAGSSDGNQAKLTISPKDSSGYFALQNGFNGKLEKSI